MCGRAAGAGGDTTDTMGLGLSRRLMAIDHAFERGVRPMPEAGPAYPAAEGRSGPRRPRRLRLPTSSTVLCGDRPEPAPGGRRHRRSHGCRLASPSPSCPTPSAAGLSVGRWPITCVLMGFDHSAGGLGIRHWPSAGAARRRAGAPRWVLSATPTIPPWPRACSLRGRSGLDPRLRVARPPSLPLAGRGMEGPLRRQRRLLRSAAPAHGARIPLARRLRAGDAAGPVIRAQPPDRHQKPADPSAGRSAGSARLRPIQRSSKGATRS